MALLTSSFSSIASMDASYQTLLTEVDDFTDTLNSATDAYDNIGSYDVSFFSVETSTRLDAQLTNGDRVIVTGSNLLNYPATINSGTYIFSNFSATPGLQIQFFGSVVVPNEFDDERGAITKIIVKDGATTITMVGSDNVSLFGDTKLSSIQFDSNGVSLLLKGNILIDDFFNVTGSITSLTLSHGTSVATLSGFSMSFNLFDSFNNVSDFLENILNGNDVLNGSGLAETLNGFAGADNLKALAGADTVNGGDGNDTLDGGAGIDSLVGGADDDIYLIDNAGDEVNEEINAGSDLVRVNIATAGGVYTLTDNVENGILLNTVAFNLAGNGLSNKLTGNALANILIGGDGEDTLTGGAGDDVYFVDASDVVVESTSSGNDTEHFGNGSSTYTLAANVENGYLDTVNTADLTGNAANNQLEGNSANNTLFGLAGNDTLDGNGGSDTLIGGDGNDSYVVHSNNDHVTETNTIAGGIDTVHSDVSYTLGDNIENLTLLSAALTANGNNLNNVITGNSLDNTLNGATGDDTLIGGAGDDDYLVNSATDVLTEVLNAGDDTAYIFGVTHYALGANIENVYLMQNTNSVTGNVANNNIEANGLNNNIDGGAGNDSLFGRYGRDVLLGGLGDDTLDGGAGADTLNGGAGNDTYLISAGDQIIADLSGVDMISTNQSTFNLSDIATNGEGTSAIENIVYTGTFKFKATGNALANNMTGGALADRLSGDAGNDTLNGGAGNDTLFGGVGNDIINGGIGNDYLLGDAGNDVLTGGDGQDILTGGLGADRFKFNFTTESNANADVITDFNHSELDKIDLSSIDANTNTVGIQGFSFIGAGAFTAAGQLRFDATSHTVLGDTDGDGTTDFQIFLNGISSLVSSDFV